jgi:hypothetical protein
MCLEFIFPLMNYVIHFFLFTAFTLVLTLLTLLRFLLGGMGVWQEKLCEDEPWETSKKTCDNVLLGAQQHACCYFYSSEQIYILPKGTSVFSLLVPILLLNEANICNT